MWELFFVDFVFFVNGNGLLMNSSQLTKLLLLLFFQAVVGLNRKCGFVVS